MTAGPLLDNSELTLDLIHILELVDNSANYGKILVLCNGLQEKVARIRDAVRQLPGTSEPYDPEAAREGLERVRKRGERWHELLLKYEEQLKLA